MKILYLGLPLGALMLYQEGHTLVGACISRPSMPGMRRVRRMMSLHRAPLLGRPDLTQPTVQALLASTEPDLVVSWFWTRRIPPAVIAMGKRGGINVHPSLLPRHRGPDPYFWTILKGDAETGVTVHRLTANYDEGAILDQRRVPTPPDVNAWELARRLDRPSLEALRDVVNGIDQGSVDLAGTAQEHARATLAPRPTDDDCEILWDAPAREVLARVRAASPEPGAFTGFGDETVVVLRARRAEWVPGGLQPGDAVKTREGVVVVCARGEAVVLTRARREDDDAALEGDAIAALFPGIGDARQ